MTSQSLGMRVVVDDHELVLRGVRRPLERAGYEVIEGRVRRTAAMPPSNAPCPALIVLDFDLPDIDSGELRRRLERQDDLARGRRRRRAGCYSGLAWPL